MRFNPPPGWPPARDGWQPTPDWQPDPSWPPAPDGWQLWVDDGGSTRTDPTSGPTESRSTRERRRTFEWLVSDTLAVIVVVTVCVEWFFVTHDKQSSNAVPLSLTALIGLAGLIFVVSREIARTNSSAKIKASHTPVTPIGYTTDGQPIYPVVGYTTDGRPVTADRAVAVRPAATGTNSMAIVALITGLTIAPLGIVFGHIALSQINQTGQSGRGLAIAGLVLGYVSLAAVILLTVVSLTS